MIEQWFEERGGFAQKGKTKAHTFTEKAFLLCILSQNNRLLSGGKETPGVEQLESVYVSWGKKKNQGVGKGR